MISIMTRILCFASGTIKFSKLAIGEHITLKPPVVKH